MIENYLTLDFDKVYLYTDIKVERKFCEIPFSISAPWKSEPKGQCKNSQAKGTEPDNTLENNLIVPKK